MHVEPRNIDRPDDPPGSPDGPPGSPDDRAQERVLLELLERYYTALESNAAPDLDAYCADHPEFASRLRDLVEREHEWTGMPGALAPGRPLPGRLGAYEILGELGHGGMSSVHLAREPGLPREVAIKVLCGEAALDPTVRARFRREGEITAALDHPNIVPVYAVGEEAGVLFLVMKRIRGPSLADAGVFSPRDTAAIGAKLCRALHEAHLSGVIHRDVKPSNIMLDEGEPVLLDFGLAYGLGDVSLTRTGTAAGTVLYMSPEQLRGAGSALDPRTDVYSLGATLYEASCGRPPFDPAMPLPELMEAITHRDPRPMRLSSRARDLETILRRAMERDRDRRFPTALAMAEDLERYLADEPISSARSGIIVRIVKLSRRHRAASAALLLLLPVILLLAGFVATEAYAKRRLVDADYRRAVDILRLEGDTVRARELLRSLHARRSDDKIEAALDECLAAEALDRFFDVVHEIDRDRGLYGVRELRRELERYQRYAPGNRRQPMSDLSLAIARFALGELSEARRILEDSTAAAGTTPGSAAVVALVGGADPDAAMDGATRVDLAVAAMSDLARADDRVLAALALRLAGADQVAVRRQIDEARAVQPNHYRAREALALLERRAGNHEKALGLFLGLVTAEGARPVTLLHQAFQALVLQDVPLAESILDRVPESDRSARYMLARAQILRMTTQFESALAFLDVACARFVDDGDLLAERGYTLLASGDRDGAFRCLERARALDVRRFVVDRIDAAMASIEVSRELEGLAQPDEGAGSRLSALSARIRSQAAEAVDPSGRSDLLVLQNRVDRLLGRDDDAWAALQEALEVDAGNPVAKMVFSLWVAEYEVKARLGGPTSPVRRRDVWKAESFAVGLAERSHQAGARPATDQCYQDAIYALYLFAFCRRDTQEFERIYPLLETEAQHYWTRDRESIDLLRGLMME